jgi:hypothetical protein
MTDGVIAEARAEAGRGAVVAKSPASAFERTPG